MFRTRVPRPTKLPPLLSLPAFAPPPTTSYSKSSKRGKRSSNTKSSNKASEKRKQLKHMAVFNNPYERPINESTSVITSAKASAAFRRLAYFH